MISIPFVAAVVLGPVLVLGCLGVGWWLHHRYLPGASEEDRPYVIALSVVAYFAAVVFFIGFAVGLYPYDMEYHSYRHVQGTVAATQPRLLRNGDSTSQYYALRLREDGKTYRCDDTRCSLIKQGDQVALWCIREYEYASTSGWGCRFDSTRPQEPVR